MEYIVTIKHVVKANSRQEAIELVAKYYTSREFQMIQEMLKEPQVKITDVDVV